VKRLDPVSHSTAKCFVAVQGCRKFEAPAGSSVTEEGNTATVRCNGSKETWYFTCSDTRWRGRVVNCTNKGDYSSPVCPTSTLCITGLR